MPKISDQNVHYDRELYICVVIGDFQFPLTPPIAHIFVWTEEQQAKRANQIVFTFLRNFFFTFWLWRPEQKPHNIANVPKIDDYCAS